MTYRIRMLFGVEMAVNVIQNDLNHHNDSLGSPRNCEKKVNGLKVGLPPHKNLAKKRKKPRKIAGEVKNIIKKSQKIEQNLTKKANEVCEVVWSLDPSQKITKIKERSTTNADSLGSTEKTGKKRGGSTSHSDSLPPTMVQIIDLYKSFDGFKYANDTDIFFHIYPSLKNNQYKFHTKNNKLIGFCNWAFFNNYYENKFLETGEVDDNAWASGNKVWVIDLMATDNTKNIINWNKQYFTKLLGIDKKVSWLRFYNDKIIAKEFYTKGHYI